MPPMDPVMHAGLSAADAPKAMTVPKGFKVTLAAAEPDVIRPIAFTIDDRGRLWVAEGRTYPVRAPEGQGRDRILILEDTNGDGTLDSRKVFVEGLNLVSGIEVGFGGVWVGAAPNLLFIPIKDGTTARRARRRCCSTAGATRTRTRRSTRFTWGPDGWLYGAHGVFTHSNVGKPGAPSRSARRSTPACGATTRRSTSSRCSPRAPATRGALTSTITGTRSRPPASSSTSISRAGRAATSGRRASTSTPTSTTTSRPSRTTCTGSGTPGPARREQPARDRPAAATRTPAR